MAEDTKPTEPQAVAKKLAKGEVEVRVLKLGHDKIHTGSADNAKFAHGDKFVVHTSIAEVHETKGYVEIL
jgi:hypothetical protein